MRPKYLDIDPINVDADGICESQTPAAGGSQSLTIDGVLADLGTAGVFDIYDAGYSVGVGGVIIGIASAGNDSGRTFTVTGTNEMGHDVTETITGPNATTVQSSTYFKTITAITVDDDTAGAITVGTVDEVASVVVPMNWRAYNFKVGFSVDVTGTVDYTLQHTLVDVFDTTLTHKWFNHDVTANQTTDQDGNYVIPVRAIRLVTNSYSSGAEIALNLVQGG